MESRPVLPHNKPKACPKPESRSKTQHQETTMPPGMRGGIGSFQAKKKAKLIDTPMQTKTPTSTVMPSTSTTFTPASPTASPATLKTLLGPGTTASSVTSTTILMTNFPHKHAVGINQEPKASKSIHKTTSQVSASTDLPKSLQKSPSIVLTATALHKSVQRATLSQIPNPKVRSSPTGVDQTETFCKGRSKELEPSCTHRFKFNDNGAGVMEDSQEVDNVQPLGTSKVEMLHRTKDEEKHRDRKEECILKDIQVACTFKGSDIAAQVTSQCPLFPLDSIQLSPGATTTSASQMKDTAGEADENTMAWERECEKEKRREWKKSVERKETLEKRVGHKGKDEEKKLEENVEKEKKVQDGNNKAKERERKEKEKNLKHLLKSLKEAATMTEEIPVPVHITESAMQTEVFYEDAEIQAVVEVSNQSTTMSPNITHSFWSHTDPQVNPSNHDQVTGAGSGSVSVHNGLNQDISLDSGLSPVPLASVGSMAKSLCPTLHKSSLTSKPNRQHVCQIQIELCSQSMLSDSLALPVDEKSQVGLERKPKQVDREGDQAERGPLPEVAWDEQGLTWEVYGAAVDMEFLGFAIQNHLQRKIHEHEQRIRHLRKSVSLSEHSNGEGRGAIKKRKKSNVFRSLFQRPTCCLKTESEV